MIDVKKVEKGGLVLVESTKDGKTKFFLGMVSLPDPDRNEVGIKRVFDYDIENGKLKVSEETKSFPASKIFRPDDFTDHIGERERGQNRFSYRPPSRENGPLTQVLTGFIATLSTKLNDAGLQEVAQELRNKGLVKGEVRTQEVLEALYNFHNK